MKELNLKNYEITLLTSEEYKTFRANIPCVICWWWLRSPGRYYEYALAVNSDGSVNYDGDNVNYHLNAVRPVLKSNDIDLQIGAKFIAIGNRWVVIGEHIAISESVISFRSYDSMNNHWESSELKQWLEEWAIEAKNETD